MAASDVRSSARVCPRSVSRVAAVSAITSSTVGGRGLDRAGDRHVAHGAVADGGLEHVLLVRLQPLRGGEQHPVALEHLALVGEVDARHLQLLLADVAPDVELGPVGEREHAHVLALGDRAVVDVPQLGPLAARVPLPVDVAEGEDALLRAGALLVAAGAAERRVEVVRGDRVQQRDRLQPVARAALVGDAARVDRLLHGGDDQPLAQLVHAPVAELDHLGEVVPRVHVHDRERQRAGAERLLRQPQQHDRVLAAGEQQHGPLELGGDLAHDVDRLGLERAQLRHRGGAVAVGGAPPGAPPPRAAALLDEALRPLLRAPVGLAAHRRVGDRDVGRLPDVLEHAAHGRVRVAREVLVGDAVRLDAALGEPRVPRAVVLLQPALEVGDRALVVDRLAAGGVAVLGAPLAGLDRAPERDRLAELVAAADVHPVDVRERRPPARRGKSPRYAHIIFEPKTPLSVVPRSSASPSCCSHVRAGERDEQRREEVEQRRVVDALEVLPRLSGPSRSVEELEELLGTAGDAGRAEQLAQKRAATALGGADEVGACGGHGLFSILPVDKG